MSTPVRTAWMLLGPLAFTRPWSASGEDAGHNTDFRWKMSRGRADLGVFPPADDAVVVSIACELPSKFDLPLSQFSLDEICALVNEQIEAEMSRSTIWRRLHEHAIRPWLQRMWLFPRDPLFLERATPALDLYHGLWNGQPLASDDFVICADEKTGMQALERRHPPVPPGKGRPALQENEYIRHGTQAYLAALDVQNGRIFGRVGDTTGIQPFMRLVDHVMQRRPYKDAQRVFWIVDGGPSHHRNTFPERLSKRYPNAVAVMLPVHASWLNQIELYFSILQRKLLKRGHFTSLANLVDAVLRFQDRYNKSARPFHWRFTAADLRERLVMS